MNHVYDEPERALDVGDVLAAAAQMATATRALLLAIALDNGIEQAKVVATEALVQYTRVWKAMR